tara:strand:+ start:10313 stop:11476 length:1164 start_codon:yes stop_codon:yes gene_type:complete
LKRAIIRAPLLTYSGYGVHSRQVFKWLKNRGDFHITSQVLNWGQTPWMINPDAENGLAREIMSTAGDPGGEYDLSIQLQLPDEWDASLAKYNIGMSAFVETDICSESWVESSNTMDCIIVPSNHCKNTVLKSGNLKTPIHVVPESFPSEVLDETISPLDINIDTSFNFLIVSQFTGGDPWSDRKNIFFTIKWICETFADDPNVGIILKSNHGKGTKIDREITKRTLKRLIEEVRPGLFPKIHLVHGNMTTEEMVGLYKSDKVSCLLSATRGEGYGLPLLEAAAMGVPVIATNWSGHLDFMNLGKFIPIDYKMVEIPESRIDNRIFFKGFRWAEPIEEDFKKKITKFRYNYEKPRTWAASLSSKVKQQLSHDSVSKIYDNILKLETGI